MGYECAKMFVSQKYIDMVSRWCDVWIQRVISVKGGSNQTSWSDKVHW
jgi:hypothetical protein